MYICNRCGNLCEDDELPTYEEDFGFETGVGWKAMKQTFVDTCSCGGDFVEARECALCGEYFDKEEGWRVCKHCLEEGATYENALAVGEENKDSVKINGFLANVFTESQIEEILQRELDQARKLTPTDINEQAKQYCLDDSDYFGDWLEKNG